MSGFGDIYAMTVTRLRAEATADKYGNPGAVRDWAHAQRTEFSGVAVQPQEQVETVGDRTALTTGWHLFTPPGMDMDLLPTDRIEYDGIVYEVDGEVARFGLAGRVHHIETRIVRVGG